MNTSAHTINNNHNNKNKNNIRTHTKLRKCAHLFAEFILCVYNIILYYIIIQHVPHKPPTAAAVE